MKNTLVKAAAVTITAVALLGSGAGIATAAPTQQSGTAAVAAHPCSLWDYITHKKGCGY